MKAILPVTFRISEEETKTEMMLFDTEKAIKVCDIKNSFDFAVDTVYISNSGIFFKVDNVQNIVSLPISQDEMKRWVGQHYPERYIELFGEVKES